MVALSIDVASVCGANVTVVAVLWCTGRTKRSDALVIDGASIAIVTPTLECNVDAPQGVVAHVRGARVAVIAIELVPRDADSTRTNIIHCASSTVTAGTG